MAFSVRAPDQAGDFLGGGECPRAIGGGMELFGEHGFSSGTSPAGKGAHEIGQSFAEG